MRERVCRRWRNASVIARRVVVLAVSGVVVISAVAVASVSTRSQQTGSTPSREARRNRSRAVSTADRMLGKVTLPPGSRRIAAPPTDLRKVLARPYESFWVASQVDRHAFWRTSSSFEAAMASIEGHLPKGVTRTGYALEPGVNASDTFAFPTIDRSSLGARQLVVETFALPGGGSIVRADGEVRYIAPRPHDERIPKQARVLEITVGSNLPRSLLSRRVTNVSDVRRVARMVDALSFVGNEHGAVFSCGVTLPGFPIDRFVFRGPGGAKIAKVTESAGQPTTDDPCNVTSLTIRGQHEPPLQDGGVLLRHAGELLNAQLTCTIKLVRVPGGPGHRTKEEVQCRVG
jgi:hypothetical protein